MGADRLGDRLDVANPDDELGALAMTFNELLDRLQSAFERMKQFMADASHEVRTPVAVIRSGATVALTPPVTLDECVETLEIISDQTVRHEPARRRHVLSCPGRRRCDSRRPRRIGRPERVVARCLRTASPLARSAASKLGVPKEAQVAATCPGDVATTRADAHEPARQWDQPRAPGRRGSRRGSERCAVPQRDRCCLDVRDTGPGIPAEYHEAVFERFRRLDASRSRDTGGSGLGLPIARWIAEAHGGTIALSESDAGGCTFTVTLPAGVARSVHGGRDLSRGRARQLSENVRPVHRTVMCTSVGWDDFRIRSPSARHLRIRFDHHQPEPRSGEFEQQRRGIEMGSNENEPTTVSDGRESRVGRCFAIWPSPEAWQRIAIRSEFALAGDAGSPADPRLPVRFALLGDWGNGDQSTIDIARQMTAVHDKTPLDMVVTAGDNIYPDGSASSFQKLLRETLRAAAHTQRSVLCLPREPRRAVRTRGAGEVPALRHGRTQLLLVHEGRRNGRGLRARFERDESDAAHVARWRARGARPRSGRSRFSITRRSRPGNQHGSDTSIRADVHPLFVRHGVQVVFSGHDHIYQRVTLQNDVQYFVSGAGGKIRVGDVNRKDKLVAVGLRLRQPLHGARRRRAGASDSVRSTRTARLSTRAPSAIAVRRGHVLPVASMRTSRRIFVG